MKKLIYVLIGIFTFSIGFWLFHMRPLVMTVSLCEISRRDVKFLKSKQIRVKAFLDNVGRDENDLNLSVFDFGNGCLKGAELEISDRIKEQLKSNENLNASMSLIRQKREEEFENRRNPIYTPVHYFAEVEITGEIKNYDSEDEALVESLPFVIKVNEIKQISPIRLISNEEFLHITNLK